MKSVRMADLVDLGRVLGVNREGHPCCLLCSRDLDGALHEPRCPGALFTGEGVVFRVDVNEGDAADPYVRTYTSPDLGQLATELSRFSPDDWGELDALVNLDTLGALVPGTADTPLRWLRDRALSLGEERIRLEKDARRKARAQQERGERIRTLRRQYRRLQRERTDLTPEAYERRRAALLTRYADVADEALKPSGE